MTEDVLDPRLGPELPGLRCLGLLGSGGFAEVYLYERDQPKIRVAVKLIKSSVLDDSKRRQFTAEADAMAELAEHPFIVPVLGAGTAPDGRPYLLMRYYPSSDLAARVAAHPMSVPEALRFGVQLASAVETAHRAGIIHRDIKPSNILLSSYGQPGLSDFGIAGRPNDASDDQVGVSIPWSPPEVLSGVSNGSVTSDVYSLGATIWTLLVGRPPFTLRMGDNSDRATFTRILHTKPPSTGRQDVPASLDRILQQCLAKDPALRVQSALEFARHLQRIEQELRLARTEVVVLDQGGFTRAPLKAPTATVTPVLKAAVTRTLSGSNAHVVHEATIRRTPQSGGPVQAIPSSDHSVLPREGRGDLAERPTEQRPRAATPVQTPRPTPTRTRSRGRSFIVAGGLVAALVAVAGAAVAVNHRGEGSSRTPENLGTTSTAQADKRITDVTGASAVNAPTKVTGQARKQTVTFRWPRVPGASAYLYRTDGAAPWRQTALNTVRIPQTARGLTCLTVESVAPGAANSTGTRGCA